MRLGVDFGTTRIVVASSDRGNYPVCSFEPPSGETCEWFPSLAAAREGELLYGWRAWDAQVDPRATVVRSIKRYLGDAGPRTQVDIAGLSIAMPELLEGMCRELALWLREKSSLKLKAGDRFEILLGVPANANGNQRFLTVEAFRQAGFEVLGLLNEPSAASIEYGHGARASRTGTARDLILVYDLGGGTFDASLVEIGENRHEVLASEGIAALGGDDFDEVLAEMALDAAAVPASKRESMTQREWFLLHEECRRQKEALHPNTRRIAIDLDSVRAGWPAISISAADFYARCQPLVDETVHATEDLLAGRKEDIEVLYITGGASEMPQVSRALKEQFGRRVRRSSYTRSATAIGLAIQADAQSSYRLREKFTRNFGVWREADEGRVMIFDPLFLKGTALPAARGAPLEVTRSYYSVHNVGHFRYLECGRTGDDGRPAGEITVWDEILFPFNPALRDRTDLAPVPVVREPWEAQEVEERYRCDSGGSVSVAIRNRSADYERTYRLGRWAAPAEPVVPGKMVAGKKRARARSKTSRS